MGVVFTAHDIRLDDGTLTKPEIGLTMDRYPWLLAAKRILETVFPSDKSGLRIADIGCLEGGYAVEFARMGFQVLGVDVREANIAACRFAKSHTDLPNLEFVRDDAWNIEKYGPFDAVFCCGLLYYFDRPKRFLETVARITEKMIILQTHFADGQTRWYEKLPASFKRVILKLPKVPMSSTMKFKLSAIAENESLKGRWYTEFYSEKALDDREKAKWSSWNNHRSFWIRREDLLQTLKDVGFDLVLEQFDGLDPEINVSMRNGYYQTDSRGTFIGIKSRSS